MCILPGKNATIKPCNEKTWSRFLSFVPQWQKYDQHQSQIANDFVRANAQAAEFGRCDEAVCAVPNDAGFHQKCYSLFTDKQGIARAEARLERKRKLLASTSAHASSTGRPKDIFIIILTHSYRHSFCK